MIGVCKQEGVETQSSFGYPVRSRPASKLDYFALGYVNQNSEGCHQEYTKEYMERKRKKGLKNTVDK